MNPARGFASAPVGGGGFNRLAAGKKHYGAGRSAPNVGKVGNAEAQAGYQQRDTLGAARRDALIRRATGGK